MPHVTPIINTIVTTVAPTIPIGINTKLTLESRASTTLVKKKYRNIANPAVIASVNEMLIS